MDLVLIVCLVASPQICREERLLVGGERSDARNCMVGAMPVIAELAGQRPEWQVSRWRCEANADARWTRTFD